MPKDDCGREYVLRFVIVQQDKEMGGVTMADARQGRNTYATRDEAERHLAARMANNSRDTLESVYTLPLEVREWRCYARHFDPIGPNEEEN